MVESVELRSRADGAEGIAKGLNTAPAKAPASRLVTWLRSLPEAFRP